VQVVDERAGLARGWVATVSSSDFATGDGTPAETIGKSNVWYWSGAATSSSGLAVFVPGQLTGLVAVQLSTAQGAFSGTVTSGAASVTWVPTIHVQVPPTAVAGQYHGTITHSVA